VQWYRNSLPCVQVHHWTNQLHRQGVIRWWSVSFWTNWQHVTEPEGSPKRLNTVNIISLFYIQFNIILWIFVLKYASMHFSPHVITLIILNGAKIESLINFTQPSSHIVLGSSGPLGVPYPNTHRLWELLLSGPSHSE